MSILIAVLIFGALVLFHEWGHFLAAKKVGVVVTEFSLGMGPRLISKQFGETRYSWKLLPIGGSCMMLGEFDDEPVPGSFQSKSVWQRIFIIVMGPVFNFIMAFVLAVILMAMVGYDKPVVQEVMEGMPAAEAGLEAGDEITSIDGRHICLYAEITDYVTFHQDVLAERPVKVTWNHDGEKKSAMIRAAASDDERFILGIRGSSNFRTKAGPVTAVTYGAAQVRYWVRLVFESLGMLFKGQAKVSDLSGPVGVVSTINNTYQETRADGMFYVIVNLINLTILLSANLGVVNLFPIPALDGGRILLLLIEAVRGKKMTTEHEGMIQFAGFAFLMLLMVVVMFNDIGRLF